MRVEVCGWKVVGKGWRVKGGRWRAEGGPTILSPERVEGEEMRVLSAG